ncbi:YciI family protein [Streptomyces sp. TLI_171]|uniref:YciI family protein n=1 Tax=Streptomyces sp. TLI_171 TaxID=1938859 RepID=UPI000C18E891|nr:YciI family protein [Streptomyces sp. TLI_171]
MFILELTYTAPLERIDALLPAHLAWLRQHYADGTFLASGRKVPRDGGIILAVAADRPAVEALAATDPFVPAAVATYRITEFVPTTTGPELAAHRETLPA